MTEADSFANVVLSTDPLGTAAGCQGDGGDCGDTTHTLAVGEMRCQLIGVKKLVTNYETYVSYEIETLANKTDYPSQKCTVERRYREFDWLHRLLLETYVILFVPPLPGKKTLTQLNRYATGFVDRRCSGLQTFLRKSTTHPVLSTNSHLIAFLTLPQPAFHEYMQTNSAESSIFGLIRGGPLSAMASSPQNRRSATTSSAINSKEPASSSSSPTSPANPRPPSSSNIVIEVLEDGDERALLQASEKFRRYHEEVTAYTSLCQRLAATVNRMSGQLATLSYDCADLAKALDDWPAVIGDGTKGPSNTPPSTSTASLVAAAMRQTALANQGLASRLTCGLENAMHDAANFGDAIRVVLRNRGAIQAEYARVVEQIEELVRVGERGQTGQTPSAPLSVTAGDATTATKTPTFGVQSWFSRLAVMPWSRRNKQPLESLIVKANGLRDELTFANSQIELEWKRWRGSSHAEETATNMATLAETFADYWMSMAEAWREVATAKPNTNVQLRLVSQLESIDSVAPPPMEKTSASLLQQHEELISFNAIGEEE